MIGEYIVIFLALAMSGLVKGVIGAGLPIVAVPVLASFFDVPFAVAVLAVPLAVTNLWQFWQFRAERHGRGWLWGMCALCAVGIMGGTWLLASLPEDVLSLILAATLAVYVALRLVHPHWRLPDRAVAPLAQVSGFLSGLLQGATGISAPFSLTFLSALGLTRAAFVFIASALFSTAAIFQTGSLAVAGILTRDRLLLSILALVPIFAGMAVGSWLASRLSREAFDRLVLALLVVMTVKLVYGVFA
jgi:uncharacterized membrane protein YfcA